jgi:hypothetical protein
MSISSRLKKAAVVLGVSVAVATSFGAPANAATGVIDSATPNTGVVSGVTAVTVEGSTPSPVTGKDYYLGVCETASYPFGIPACAWSATVDTGNAPDFSEDIYPEETPANSHYGAPGQPANLDCSSPGDCIIVVAEHDATTGGSVVIGTESITFA